jgi:hypothetical protein
LDGNIASETPVEIVRLYTTSTWSSASSMVGNDLDNNTGNLIV